MLYSRYSGGSMGRIFQAMIGIITLWTFICSTAWADVSLAGSSTIHPIIKQAAAIFQKETGIAVHSQGGGSSSGIRGATEGTVDIGMVSKKLDPSQTQALTSHTIGNDGIAIIVNTDNAITGLSRDQIVEIFSGRLANWKQLDFRDKKIILITKEQGRSTKQLFEEFFSLRGKIPESARAIGSNTEEIMFVASDPYAIGYVSIGSAETAHDHGVFIKPLALDGVAATIANVANGNYPLRRPLNLVTRGRPGEEAGQFIDFLLSPRGQEIVIKEGFIPVNLSNSKKARQ